MSDSAWLSGKTVGRYRVGPLLGRGGMGEVYRAEDVELRRQVALKVLPEALVGDPDRLSRFVQEARTASALNHPHLVSIYEIGHAAPDGAGRPVHFIAMELVQGDTLRHLLDGRRLDLKKTLEYLGQAAEALAAAHAAGIVHRDLKPENLMIGDGYAKVLDFGLAKLRMDSALPATAAEGATVTRAPDLSPAAGTSPGVVMGTIGYMSPEQAQGLTVDHRSDIFSFGCILYEAATGGRPFSGSSAVDTLHKIIHAQPLPVMQLAPSAPAELQRIVRKCLAKSPDERYQSMKDLALDLRDLRREMDSGSTSSVVSAAALPVKPVRSRRVLIGTFAVLLVVAVAAAAWMLRPREAPGAAVGLSFQQITTSGNVIDAVISADGKYVAYVESAGGQQALWLRQTRGGQPLQLAAPKGGFWGVTFSPDATSIYFVIKSAAEPTGTLFNIPTLGGSPRPIVSGIDSSVTLSPDGSRVAYYRVEPGETGASSLMIAGLDGGTPAPLVTRHPPQFLAPGFFVNPSWSPDGRHIVTAVRNSQTRDARLVLFRVDDGSEEVLEQTYGDATFTRWMPDGSGVVVAARLPGMVSSGQLWLQPYPAGDVRRITNDMLEYRTASMTADGKLLLSVSTQATARLSIMPLSGGEERLLPEGRAAGGTGVAWRSADSPVFYIKRGATDLQVWSMAADGTGAQEVIANVRPGGVAVSPDGRWIVYAAERDGTPGLWRARSDGSAPRLLSAVNDPTWLALAPDGSVAYFTSSRDGAPATFAVSTDGGEPVRVAPLFERAAPSPDGRLLAGIYRANAQSPLTIGVLDAATGRPVHVTTDEYAPSSGSGGFAWTADGKTLLFTTAERMNLWSQPAMGGLREKVTNFSDLWIARFALSSDGKTLLLSRGTAVRDAVLLSDFR